MFTNLDLNIENYNLEKLMDLFQLEYGFNRNDLKEAKKKVLMLHPDKTGNQIDTKYFLFFINAYKKLECIYQYFEHTKSVDDAKKNIDIDKTLKTYLDKKKLNSYENQREFIKEFNKMFDAVYMRENDDGHEDWLKSDDDIYDKNSIEKSRNNQLVTRHSENDIEELSSSSFIDNNSYSDVKEAHQNSIFHYDVNEEYKKKKKFKNVMEFQQHLANQDVNPRGLEQSRQFLEERERKLNHSAMNLAYQRMNKSDNIKKNMDQYSSKFLLLK